MPEKASTTALPLERPAHVQGEGRGSTIPVDLSEIKELNDREPKPEEPAPPKPKPEMGKQPDLSNPDPEKQIPGKPMSDMDPPGQDQPEEG